MAPRTTALLDKTTRLEQPRDDEWSPGPSDNEYNPMEKDSTEEELERLLFGDSAGFWKGIKTFAQDGTRAVEGKELEKAKEGENGNGETGLEDLADADLFFLDSGPAPTSEDALALAPPSDGEDAEQGKDPPAWEDSDDERIAVSLASAPRLRKLRRTLDEDVINGKEYSRRLRRQFERLYPAPEWVLEATVGKKRRNSGVAESDEEWSSGGDMDVDEDDAPSAQPLAELLRDAEGLIRRSEKGPSKRRKLRPEVLDIQRLKDIEGTQPSAITSLSIHPTLPLLLSSGPSSTIYLHHIHPHPPRPNPLLTSLHIKHTPLTTSSFAPSPSDPRIFLSARKRYFHIWNLQTGSIEKISRVYGHQHEQCSMEVFKLSPDGRYMALQGSGRKDGGVVNFLDASTLQWVSQARIESRNGIADFAWWRNGRGLTIVGKNGEVSEWDVEAKTLIARWNDEGTINATVVAMGGRSGRDSWLGGDRWIAIGSSSGIVNIYDRRAWIPPTTTAPDGAPPNMGVPTSPTPLRTLDQLITAISQLQFSPDGQLLAVASRWKRDALRLVHLPSCTVYRNWPTSNTPLGRISGIAFGEGGEGECWLAVGNEQGKIRLWEIRE